MTAVVMPRWLGYDWTPWLSLDKAVATGRIPAAQGVYRVRAAGADVLVYIGISDSLRKRLRRLRYARDRDDHRGHIAGAGVAAVQGSGPSVEVSWVVMDDVDRRELVGREVDLIADHRRVTGASPVCQFHGSSVPEPSAPAKRA